MKEAHIRHGFDEPAPSGLPHAVIDAVADVLFLHGVAEFDESVRPEQKVRGTLAIVTAELHDLLLQSPLAGPPPQFESGLESTLKRFLSPSLGGKFHIPELQGVSTATFDESQPLFYIHLLVGYARQALGSLSVHMLQILDEIFPL